MDDSVETASLSQLVLRERQARDRGWWDEMAAAFWPDSVVALSWYTGGGPGFVDASRAMSGRGDSSVHRLAPPVVHQQDDRAWLEVPAAIEVRGDLDGVAIDLTSYARIGYRAHRRSGEWRILTLDVVYERDTVAPVIPGTAVAIPTEALSTFRPSYALLGWHLQRRGYDVSRELLGDDEPVARDRYYADTFAWLRG